jgi:hypothetical protein
MTTKKIPHRTNGAKRRSENPEIRRAAERMNGASNGHATSERPETVWQREARVTRQERHATNLSRLATGGLYVSDDPGSGCSSEQAILRVAGATAKAIMLSLGTYTDHMIGLDGSQDTMSEDDTIAALSGLVTLLQCGPAALEALGEADQYRDSIKRWETLEKRGETEELLAAGSEASS